MKIDELEQEKAYSQQVHQWKSIAVEEFKQQLLSLINNIDYKENHHCPNNDGKQNCECYLEAIEDIIKLINNK